LSIVAASNVKGSVTIYIQDVDALGVFKMILEMNDLAYVREGNVFKVMTEQDYEKIYGRRFYDVTKVEVVKLNYAKAANVEKMLAPLKSKIGQVIPDPGTNALILIDTPENIAIMKDVIAASFDRRHQEVIIEARIIQIMLNDEFRMGVNWESVYSNAGRASYAGVRANLNALAPLDQGIRLSVGTLAVDNFTVLYDLLQTAGKTNLVSSPRIAAINNQEARILVGTREAYVTTTVTTPGTGASTTAEAVNFIDVGMKLYVTPSVGDDGFITLKIRPEVSAVERNLTTAQGNTVPIVRTSESETTVMVKDGVTVIIAGLMEERKEKTVSGVPLLCRIPVLGLPFRRTSDVTRKTELAVLLTPRIMTGDISNLSSAEKKNFKIKN
jgi:type II secretory pathway component GspD/PulD (secretin)